MDGQDKDEEQRQVVGVDNVSNSEHSQLTTTSYLSERDSGYFSPMNNSNFLYSTSDASAFNNSMTAVAENVTHSTDGATSSAMNGFLRSQSRPIHIPGSSRQELMPSEYTYESNFTPPRYHMLTERSIQRHSTSSLPLSADDQSPLSNWVVEECAQWQRNRAQLSLHSVQGYLCNLPVET